MKRKLIYLQALVLAVFMASCSSSYEPKMITPTSTEFTSGELAKYVEIVDQPSELTYAVKDGAVEAQYIRLKVTLKMVKDGIKDVEARDLNFTGLLSVATINLVDESGTNIQELNVKDEDMLKLKKLLVGKAGDTAEITFEGEFSNKKDAPKWFENAVKFTPDITGDIICGEAASSDADDDDDESDEDVAESEFADVESIDSDNDYDAILDKYEEYCNEYIKLIKKSANGDISALAEYQEFMEKAQELEQKFGDGMNELTPAQLTRFNKIHAKVLKAAQSMDN